jgi:hypothetical protein
MDIVIPSLGAPKAGWILAIVAYSKINDGWSDAIVVLYTE